MSEREREVWLRSEKDKPKSNSRACTCIHVMLDFRTLQNTALLTVATVPAPYICMGSSHTCTIVLLSFKPYCNPLINIGFSNDCALPAKHL